MQEATITTEERGLGRNKRKELPETVSFCKKSLVMPSNTITLDVDDVLFYKQNEESYKGKKSPYLIYLSTEFKRAVQERARSKRIKWMLIIGTVLVGIIFLLYLLTRIL